MQPHACKGQARGSGLRQGRKSKCLMFHGALKPFWVRHELDDPVSARAAELGLDAALLAPLHSVHEDWQDSGSLSSGTSSAFQTTEPGDMQGHRPSADSFSAWLTMAPGPAPPSLRLSSRIPATPSATPFCPPPLSVSHCPHTLLPTPHHPHPTVRQQEDQVPVGCTVRKGGGGKEGKVRAEIKRTGNRAQLHA